MGEAVQKKKKNDNEKNGDGEGGGKKKEDIPFTIVLKIDMHCEGCANKITKCVKGFEGVQSVKAEIDGNKLTVMGKKIDATKLREKLSNKTKKKVDLISPQPKKEKDSKPKDKIDDDQTSSNNNKFDKKTDENKKKPKEPPVTTAVLKVPLHCQGCIEKIQRVTTKFKGVQEMSVDRQKDSVMVKGTMDVKALIGSLSERLKRPVEIVPAKKEKEKEKENNKNEGGGGDDKKDSPTGDGDGNGNGNGNGGGKKKKKGGNGGGGEGEEGGGGGGGKMEGNKMEYMGMGGIGYGYGYGYGLNTGYGYGPGGLVGENLHAPQLFSDENPNACFIM
ncbi:heavy metal-associated isoprenylated plant protein 3-like [Cucumis melo var. makuwa]|uniref:Heavy metal-associated isoprenylated plant protein 3-like n=2 Tax=Cucumis melo TaxID=3656 RepID=A0A5A7U7D8_CUCMM|nr:heavy metal-associated isoprenylated plant protein 3-like [Cucumis melo var. makuwa]